MKIFCPQFSILIYIYRDRQEHTNTHTDRQTDWCLVRNICRRFFLVFFHIFVIVFVFFFLFLCTNLSWTDYLICLQTYEYTKCTYTYTEMVFRLLATNIGKDRVSIHCVAPVYLYLFWGKVRLNVWMKRRKEERKQGCQGKTDEWLFKPSGRHKVILHTDND